MEVFLIKHFCDLCPEEMHRFTMKLNYLGANTIDKLKYLDCQDLQDTLSVVNSRKIIQLAQGMVHKLIKNFYSTNFCSFTFEKPISALK